MAAGAMRAPDPALLAVPAGGDFGTAVVESSLGGAGDDADERGLIRLGPITLGTAGLQTRFKLRQRFQLSDKIRASVGTYYSRTDGSVGPTASITYMLDDSTRVQLDERRAFVRRKWAWSRGGVSLGLGAECAVQHTGLPPGVKPRPEVHLSLDHIKPLRYEVAGIALVLLANLPFSLREKEVEKPTLSSRLLGFARATVKRTSYAGVRIDLSEAAGVLDL